MLYIWVWAKDILTTEEIKNEITLRRDHEGRNAWHIAANRSKLEVMQKISVLAKERLTAEEIKSEMLLRTEGIPGLFQHMRSSYMKYIKYGSLLKR